MRPVTLGQVRQVVGGRALSAFPAGLEVTAVCTDTRRMEPGALFVALKGPSHDGHAYLPQAAAGGAVAALVQDEPPVRLPNVHMVQVPDTRAALGRLARHIRQQLSAKVVAVGGSNGKTSTKYLIGSVLGSCLRGSISPKSFNNDIGVPLAIFPADPTQDYLVLELGTNHKGEIRILTDIALPDIAVITSIGAEHLEGLGSLMGVRQEEASIIEGLDPRGMLVVNGDDEPLLDAVAAYPGKRVTFGLKTHNDLFATDIRCELSGVRFRLNGRREVSLPLLGRHNACNALAAIAVARRFGLSEDEIVAALASASGADMRLQAVRGNGFTIINDAYNANPNSMEAALRTLADLETAGRRIAIVGDMLELGEATDRLHRELGPLVADCGVDLLVCVGRKAALIGDSAVESGLPASQVSHFPDAATAAEVVPGWMGRGDLVLLKGSRSMKLEAIAQALTGSSDCVKVAS